MKQNKGKTAYIYFRLKWNKEKRKIRKWNEAGIKYGSKKRRKKKNMEAKRSEKKNTGAKIKFGKRKKIMKNFCLNMQNGSKTNLIWLRFTLKQKKFETKPVHPAARSTVSAAMNSDANSSILLWVHTSTSPKIPKE